MDGFSIEIVYKPIFLDNVTNLNVLNDDQQILDFMVNIEVFKGMNIEEEENERHLKEKENEHKGNPMHKGVVTLEKIFDLQNRF